MNLITSANFDISDAPEATSITAMERREDVADMPPSVKDAIAPLERHGLLFGKKLDASLSPMLHALVYDSLGLNWGQVRLDSDDIPSFLNFIRSPRFYGASVTMPNKVAILPHLDELEPECRAVGACNTIFLRETRSGGRIFCGANTDVVGVRESFLKGVPDWAARYAGRPAMVIGGGGAARSAIYALRTWLGVSEIYVVNRNRGEVDAVLKECTAAGFGQGLVPVETEEDARRVVAPGSVVACVPDFEPVTAEEKQARRVVEALLRKPGDGGDCGVMLEMCYNPSPFTRLGALAEELGWRVILGTEALIWQGLEQDRYWTGRNPEELPTEMIQQEINNVVKSRAREIPGIDKPKL